MKIICIGRNYREHAKELKNDVPNEPVFFLKPDTSLLKNKQVFYLPDFSSEIHHEVELVIKIARMGKNIEEQFAYKYYEEIGIGIDFTARDLQQIQKEKGLPWEKAKAFDGSAPLGNFVSKHTFEALNDISFKLELNDKKVQEGNTGEMIFSFDQIISHVSRFITLKVGDLIFTGTPAGVGPVKENDTLKCYIEGNKLLEFSVK